MQSHMMEGGFADAPIQSANAFRVIMGAMARPGEIGMLVGGLPPAPLSQAAGVLVLTLCDPDTSIYLAAGYDTPAVRDWVTFHTGAPIGNADQAHFAIGKWDDLKAQTFPIGTAEYPDRSTTWIVEGDLITPDGPTLRGPGIKETAQLSLPETVAFQNNAALFPLGYDYFFTAGAQIAALPRSTKVS